MKFHVYWFKMEPWCKLARWKSFSRNKTRYSQRIQWLTKNRHKEFGAHSRDPLPLSTSPRPYSHPSGGSLSIPDMQESEKVWRKTFEMPGPSLGQLGLSDGRFSCTQNNKSNEEWDFEASCFSFHLGSSRRPLATVAGSQPQASAYCWDEPHRTIHFTWCNWVSIKEAQLFGPIWSDMSESKSSNTPTVIQPVYDLHQISINFTGWIYIYISMIIHINIHLDRAWLPLNYRVHSPTPVIFPLGDDKPKLRPQASWASTSISRYFLGASVPFRDCGWNHDNWIYTVK